MNNNITRKVTIPIKEWRFGGDDYFVVKSERTADGRRCVLHFVQEQLLQINQTTVSYEAISPAILSTKEASNIYELNDQPDLTLDERMAQLEKVALKAGIKLEFTK